jgi:hypothetical protein
MQKNLRLRKVGPASYGFTIPPDFIRACGLCDGDSILWDSTADVAMLRFIKVMTQRPEKQHAQNGHVEQAPVAVE